MSNMLSFKGTKSKDLKKGSIKKQVTSNSLVKEIVEKSPIKPYLPPEYRESDIKTSIPCHPLQDTYSGAAPKLLSEILDINARQHNGTCDIMKITSTINLVFDRDTGKLKEITNIMNDDIDFGYLPQTFNIPIPELIKWLNKSHIILYSRKTIGTLLIIDSKEVVDEYPDCISCILFEKVNTQDNFDIKIVINLKYEDRYIKKSELLDVIYVNINNFWLIIKKGNDIHLLYYYKKQKEDLENKTKKSFDYVYTEFILEYYTFICSMWTVYDLSPDVIYLTVHDEYKNVSIHQYTIVNDIETNLPIIELYSVDTRLVDCGTYLSYCVNYNISVFTILLELENKDKHFYTGMMSLTQIDSHQKTNVKLEFSKTIINTKLSTYEAQIMIYTIMKKTEESIHIEDAKKHETMIINHKKTMASKELERAKKELERRDIEAKAIADTLLKEEEHDTLKKKKLQLKKNKDKEKQKNEKLEKEKLLEQERLEKEKLLEQERLEKEKLLDQERLEKEKLLEQERLEKEKIEKEKLKKEMVIKVQNEKIRVEKMRLEKIRLEKVRIEKEKLEIQRIKNVNPNKNKKIILKTSKNARIKVIETIIEETNIEEPKTKFEKHKIIVEEPKTIIQEPKAIIKVNEIEEHKIEENKIIVEQTPSVIINKPFYYVSNEIELNYTQYSLYFMFIHNISMINPTIANEIAFSHSTSKYNELLFTHRFYVMYALDMLVINNSSIHDLKQIMNRKKNNDFPISAIYGSYLPILYSILLNDLGFKYNAFGKDINPLDKLKDYDTLDLKLLHDYNETDTDNEFIREASMLIGYNTDDKPVTRTKIQSSSIHNLICKCWDLNYTSAILLFEDNHQPYIKRHPDFTEFLFGQQPIQLLFGKDETNLYDYSITMNRLKKALKTWY